MLKKSCEKNSQTVIITFGLDGLCLAVELIRAKACDLVTLTLMFVKLRCVQFAACMQSFS